MPVLVLLAAACARSPGPAPPGSLTKSPSAHGAAVNPANIKRIGHELPPGYEMTTGIPSTASPRVVWRLEAGAGPIQAKPPECAKLADPGDGHDQSAQGISGSGSGGIVDAVVVSLPELPRPLALDHNVVA